MTNDQGNHHVVSPKTTTLLKREKEITKRHPITSIFIIRYYHSSSMYVVRKRLILVLLSQKLETKSTKDSTACVVDFCIFLGFTLVFRRSVPLFSDFVALSRN